MLIPRRSARRSRTVAWAGVSALLAAVLVVLPFQSANAAEEPPAIDNCTLQIPESTDPGVIYYYLDGNTYDSNPGDALATGSHALTGLVEEFELYSSFRVNAVVAADDDVLEYWDFEYPVECAITVDIECEAFTVTDYLMYGGWMGVWLEYVTADGTSIEPDRDGNLAVFDVPAGSGTLHVEEGEMRREAEIPLTIPSCSEDGPRKPPPAGL